MAVNETTNEARTGTADAASTENDQDLSDLSFAERAGLFLRPGCAPTGWKAWWALAADSVRIVFRASALAGWLLFVYIVWLGCTGLLLGKRKALRPWRRRILKAWGRGALRIVGVRLHQEGPTPQPPFFLVANHIGYLDIVIMAATTGCVFVAKADMATWPIFGFMMRTSQQLFIRREDARDVSRAIGLLQEVYDEGDGIVIFAEGRCTDGSEIRPFRPGLFEAAARGGWPVHFAALSYATPETEPTASDALSWWRWEPVHHMFSRLLRVPRSTAKVAFAAAPLPPNSRKALAAEAHRGAVAAFEPLKPGVLPALPAPADAPRHLFGPDER